MENREGNYFNFLCFQVGKVKQYSVLLSLLHHMEFYPLIPNDDNRGEDGKELRNKFIKEEGLQALSLCQIGECSVLEMLIGLSIRLEWETMSSQWEKSPKEWFWILIDNLELGWCTDQTFQETDEAFADDPDYSRGDVRDEVVGIVSKVLERKFKRNGEEGLFPLKRPQKDQRQVEIWYQMSAYIIENYPL